MSLTEQLGTTQPNSLKLNDHEHFLDYIDPFYIEEELSLYKYIGKY